VNREDVEKVVREELARGVEVDVSVYDHERLIARGSDRYSRVPVVGESVDISRIARGLTYGKTIHVAHRRQPGGEAAIVQVQV
jgi:hypothetical protein